MNILTTIDNEEIIVDDPGDKQRFWWQRILKIASFSELLRIFGACAVLASMSLFLMNGWSEGNDIQRYLKLLAQTGLLTLGGLALSVGLKEYKGARLFYGLSLVSVAANFTILGALIYSMVQWDSALKDYPAALTWQAVEFASFWPIFAGAVVVLALLSRFSFAIFARQHAAKLCSVYLILAAGLLLPIRDSLGISFVILAATMLASFVVHRIRSDEGFVNTVETNFALATLFLPPAIMLVRAVSLYNVDAVLSILMSGLALFAFRAYNLQAHLRDAVHPSAMHRISGVIQFLLGANVAFNIALLVPSLAEPLALACLVIAMFSLTVEFVFSRRHVVLRQSYLIWSLSFMLLVTLAGGLFNDAISYKILGVMTGLAGFGLIRLARQQMETRFALLITSIVIACQCVMLALQVINLWQLNDWVMLGLAGGGLILTASFFEKYNASH